MTEELARLMAIREAHKWLLRNLDRKEVLKTYSRNWDMVFTHQTLGDKYK